MQHLELSSWSARNNHHPLRIQHLVGCSTLIKHTGHSHTEPQRVPVSLLRNPCFAAVLWWCCRRYPRTLPRLCVGGQNVQTGQDLLGCLSQHSLNVTDEAVDVAFARRLVDDVFVVVITQATAQFLIVHLGFVLALSPTLCHLWDQQEQRVEPKYV